MLLVAREGSGRGLGAGDGLTGVNQAGCRGGARRPELGKETSSRSSWWLGMAWGGAVKVRARGRARVPFYRRFEAVAENGVLRRSLRWRMALVGED